MPVQPDDPNREVMAIWNENAHFWHERMGEGNDFVRVLQWPAIERLLAIRPGERVLDIATGNGLMARRLGRLGARVTAFDFAPQMVEIASQQTTAEDGDIAYLCLDATDETALLALGEGSFDAALCNMALFDMAEIEPLFRALRRLLEPGGRFVFTLMHPCFNQPFASRLVEQEDRDGEIVTTYAVKVIGYLTPATRRGLAIRGQPRPQLYFHRPLSVLLGSGLAAGFVIDGLEERAFPPDAEPGRNALGWSGRFSEIPPVMVVRMRSPQR